VHSCLVLITGGARGGKSSFAQTQAWALGQDRVSLIATAQPLDEEMRSRIAKHQSERPATWQTLEEPLEVAQALRRAQNQVVVLDCLTLWVSNLLLAGRGVASEVEHLLAVYTETGKALLVVTNEVGWGIVPENPLARRYRDLLGAANRRIAEQADTVYLLVAGIPLRIKP